MKTIRRQYKNIKIKYKEKDGRYEVNYIGQTFYYNSFEEAEIKTKKEIDNFLNLLTKKYNELIKDIEGAIHCGEMGVGIEDDKIEEIIFNFFIKNKKLIGLQENLLNNI